MFDRGQIYDKVAHEAKVAAASARQGGSLLSSGATYQDLEKRIEEISEEDKSAESLAGMMTCCEVSVESLI